MTTKSIQEITRPFPPQASKNESENESGTLFDRLLSKELFEAGSPMTDENMHSTYGGIRNTPEKEV